MPHANPPARRRWPRRLLAGALAASLLTNLVLITTSESSTIGYWRSQAGRTEYLAAYDRVLSSMPPHRGVDLETDYGTVRGYHFPSPGNEDKTPIVLLPGWGSGTPMWQINIAGLARLRPVYAVDALGDAGRSTQTVPLDSAQTQADWIAQALAELKIDKAHLVGHSFGGWSAANLAIRHPDRVASLSLLDPVQTFGPIRWQLIGRSIAFTVPFLPQSWRDAALADIGGVEAIDPNDPMTRMVAAGNRHYVSKRSFPGQFSVPQLRSIRVPVYAAMAAESSVNADPDKAVARGKQFVPDIRIRSWSGVGHSLPMEQPDKVGSELDDFMINNEPG